VPDTYQGTEIWDFSLVDPDNRRPVDFEARRKLLAECIEREHDRSALIRDLLERRADGGIKLLVVRTLLHLRREKPELFLRGDYSPLRAGDRIIGFTRHFGSDLLLTIVPRLTVSLKAGSAFPTGDAWSDRTLRAPVRGVYRDVLTNRRIVAQGSLHLRDVFAELPVAVLLLEEPDAHH